MTTARKGTETGLSVGSLYAFPYNFPTVHADTKSGICRRLTTGVPLSDRFPTAALTKSLATVYDFIMFKALRSS